MCKFNQKTFFILLLYFFKIYFLFPLNKFFLNLEQIFKNVHKLLKF